VWKKRRRLKLSDTGNLGAIAAHMLPEFPGNQTLEDNVIGVFNCFKAQVTVED
jgi:hypothetical protein